MRSPFGDPEQPGEPKPPGEQIAPGNGQRNGHSSAGYPSSLRPSQEAMRPPRPRPMSVYQLRPRQHPIRQLRRCVRRIQWVFHKLVWD
ncbi:MAG: hypothetical protein HC840_23935 [Leptolyngbyaceae cyanobacterium RM2_2_4]|nr:hypothetical protein [Leptolyngbyaceae cyanobacterium RM2_2_4]